MTAKSFMKLLINKYRGEWISISHDYKKVLAHSKDFNKLIEKINKIKPEKGIILRIPGERFSAYVG